MSFTTEEDVNYVLFGTPYAEKPTVLIARNNNDDDVLYPNGVLFMDDYWLGLDSIERESIQKELNSQHYEITVEQLNIKIEKLVQANLLPTGLVIK